VLQVKSVLTKWIFGWSRDLHEWACLISSRTVQHNVVTVYVLFSFSFFLTFFIFSTTNQHQNILTFFTFYITSIILFITIQIKKFTTYNTFYFISHHHFLLISKLTTHYSVLFYTCLCQTSPTFQEAMLSFIVIWGFGISRL